MKTMISTLALVAALGLAGAASAQVATGGADAKGNAPLKHAHTVNDGGAKRGATSFTQKEAVKHIEHAGYTGVSSLEKGRDGVWRGTATKDGSARQVGLDFKGNVVEAGTAMTSAETSGASSQSKATPAASAPADAGASSSTATTATTSTATRAGTTRHHTRRRHARHHHAHPSASSGNCANPAPNGAACSGIDRNHNGISDKEDRAIKSGAKP